MNRNEQHIQMLLAGIASTTRLLGLTQPTYGGTPVLTPEQAQQAQRTVEKWFHSKSYEDHEMPALYQPGHEGPMWVLSLEGGPDHWPLRICHDLRDRWPDGVHAEPAASWCLGLYPA